MLKKNSMLRVVKKLRVGLVCCTAAALAACNSGGSGSSSNGGNTPTPPPGPVTPSDVTPTTMPLDPTTCLIGNCQPTTGSLSQQLSGKVMIGGVLQLQIPITAYDVNADGTNGEVLGTTFTDNLGNFSMTLSRQTRNYVRLTASDVKYRSNVDNTIQTNPALELVTPYVTTNLNYFVITPVTSIASHSFAWNLANPAIAKQKGLDGTKGRAYIWGTGAAMGLNGHNDVIGGVNNKSSEIFVSYLSMVPGSAQDINTAYQDELWLLEWFSAIWDLPSQDGIEALAQYTDNGNFPMRSFDGFGNPITVGSWLGTSWVKQFTRWLDWVMVIYNGKDNPMKYPDGYPMSVPLQTHLSDQLVTKYELAACKDASQKQAYWARFPYRETWFKEHPEMWEAACGADKANLAIQEEKVKNGNRDKYMKY